MLEGYSSGSATKNSPCLVYAFLWGRRSGGLVAMNKLLTETKRSDGLNIGGSVLFGCKTK